MFVWSIIPKQDPLLILTIVEWNKLAISAFEKDVNMQSYCAG